MRKDTDEARLYISVEGRGGQLIVDGPLGLFRELVANIRTAPTPEAGVRSAPDRTPTAVTNG